MIRVETSKLGLFQPTKGGFPVRYGERVQITTPELVLEFNVAGDLKCLTGRGPDWPHPLEYLKRTDGNDWVYYSLGEYADHIGVYGEYYLPCPAYPTNRPLGGEPFGRRTVQETLRQWPQVLEELRREAPSLSAEARAFLARLTSDEPGRLAARADQLHQILGCELPVLPPDARHVDYDVIPLIVADGCRYGCRFCRVKKVNDRGSAQLSTRSRRDIREQLDRLQSWLGDRKGDYQGLFVGLHDALAADQDTLRWALDQAFHDLGFEGTRFTRPHLFLFGSVDSLLDCDESFFDWLSASPWSTFINVGFEAATKDVLAFLGKPLSLESIGAGFERMVEVNRRWPKVDVTANFVLLPQPGEDDEAIVELVQRHQPQRSDRGLLYLSPLMPGRQRPRANRRQLLQRLHHLQRRLPVDAFLYLIQRL